MKNVNKGFRATGKNGNKGFRATVKNVNEGFRVTGKNVNKGFRVTEKNCNKGSRATGKNVDKGCDGSYIVGCSFSFSFSSRRACSSEDSARTKLRTRSKLGTLQ